jgi:iron complex transport system substrate-binding protein
VRVPAKVERILLGEGRLLPLLAVFDRDDPARRLVAMMGEFEKLDAPGYAQWTRRFPQIDKVPRVGRTSSGSFSDEQAITLKPQLAILGLAGGHGPSERDRETLARLEAAGTAVVFIDLRHDPLVNTPRSMLLLGEVLGRKAEAEAFVTYWRAQLAVVTDRLAKARPEAPTVFLENRVGLSDGCCDTMVGLVGKLLGAAGSRNVAKDLIPGEFGTLNPEFLIARQPRFYIGTGIGALATQQQMPLRVVLGADATPEAAQASLARAVQRRGIAQLQAVKEGRAYAMWHHFYNSPFNVVAVQVFAKWLHPELFADLDPRATLQTMYDRFQPIALEGVYWTALKP